MRDINYIVIHCFDTPEGMAFDVEDARRWHVEERGWSDVGYHYVVTLDGTVQKGRPVERSGAHVRGFNKNSIGISYVGGQDDRGKAKDTRTPEQKKSLRNLVETLKNIYPNAVVLGHRDFKGVNKYCPSFDVKTEL